MIEVERYPPDTKCGQLLEVREADQVELMCVVHETSAKEYSKQAIIKVTALFVSTVNSQGLVPDSTTRVSAVECGLREHV